MNKSYLKLKKRAKRLDILMHVIAGSCMVFCLITLIHHPWVFWFMGNIFMPSLMGNILTQIIFLGTAISMVIILYQWYYKTFNTVLKTQDKL